MRNFGPAAVGVALGMLAGAARAQINIHFTGMNLTYDSASLHDGGSIAGGVGDPGDADALATVDFFNGGLLVGSLDADVWLDLFIPDVVGIAAGTNAVSVLTTPGNPGYADLLIGTSPLASDFLRVDLASVTVTNVDAGGLVQFVFAGALGASSTQQLPFGLVMQQPVTFSFSAQVVPGTLTSVRGVVTGFRAFGTGEYSAVPAPAAASLLSVVGAALLRRRR